MSDLPEEPHYYTAAELMKNYKPGQHAKYEEEYRRGYCDGYIEAAQAMDELCGSGRTDFRAVYNLLFTHWERALENWARGDCKQLDLPPHIPIPRGSRSASVRKEVFERDKGLCGICHGPVDPKKWHLDHVVALANGGSDDIDNLQVTHPSCNARKWAF